VHLKLCTNCSDWRDLAASFHSFRLKMRRWQAVYRIYKAHSFLRASKSLMSSSKEWSETDSCVTRGSSRNSWRIRISQPRRSIETLRALTTWISFWMRARFPILFNQTKNLHFPNTSWPQARNTLPTVHTWFWRPDLALQRWPANITTAMMRPNRKHCSVKT